MSDDWGRVALTEYGPSVERQLSDDVGIALAATGFVDASSASGHRHVDAAGDVEGRHPARRDAGGDRSPEGSG